MKYLRLVCLVLPSLLNGQTLQSPYSIFGLGEFIFPGLSQNMAMGNVGIGTESNRHINILNPANLTHNQLSSFQVGINGDFRRYSGTEDDYESTSANLRYLALSFPVVSNRWTTAFSLVPLSIVDYSTYSADSLDAGENVVIQNKGDGGVTQLAWGNGFRIFKQLSMGVKAAFIFGSINKNADIFLTGEEVSSVYVVAYNKKTVYSDFLFSASLAYRVQLSDVKYLSFGALYEFPKDVAGSEKQTLGRETIGGIGDPAPILLNENITRKESLPENLGVGVSYGIINKFKIGADMQYRNWSKFNPEKGVLYRNTMDLSAGFEIIPDIASVSSYIKRIVYRAGISYRQLPYRVNNKQINDFGVNFGISFPVNGISSLDTVVKIGSRGATTNNLIRENYIQFVLGATINDKWFIKRRYD